MRRGLATLRLTTKIESIGTNGQYSFLRANRGKKKKKKKKKKKNALRSQLTEPTAERTARQFCWECIGRLGANYNRREQ
jgi:hypothetical protein